MMMLFWCFWRSCSCCSCPFSSCTSHTQSGGEGIGTHYCSTLADVRGVAVTLVLPNATKFSHSKSNSSSNSNNHSFSPLTALVSLVRSSLPRMHSHKNNQNNYRKNNNSNNDHNTEDDDTASGRLTKACVAVDSVALSFSLPLLHFLYIAGGAALRIAGTHSNAYANAALALVQQRPTWEAAAGAK